MKEVALLDCGHEKESEFLLFFSIQDIFQYCIFRGS